VRSFFVTSLDSMIWDLGLWIADLWTTETVTARIAPS
jgi:hypothetical protein